MRNFVSSFFNHLVCYSQAESTMMLFLEYKWTVLIDSTLRQKAALHSQCAYPKSASGSLQLDVTVEKVLAEFLKCLLQEVHPCMNKRIIWERLWLQQVSVTCCTKHFRKCCPNPVRLMCRAWWKELGTDQHLLIQN